MTYDNIKSHKKPRFDPLFRRYIFWKTTEEGQTYLSPNPPSRFRVNTIKLNFQIAFSLWWPPLSIKIKWRTVNTNIFSRLLDKMQKVSGAYSQPSLTSTMEFYCENSELVLAANYIC